MPLDITPDMITMVATSLVSSALVVVPAVFYLGKKVGSWEDKVGLMWEERGKARPFCASQEERLLKKAEEVALVTVTTALKDLIITNNKELAGINTNLALLKQSNDQIKDDINELFERLNRRHDEPQYTDPPYGRRKTGVL